MKSVLHNYDIYPKVVLSDVTNRITIKPLGDHAAFESGKEYTVKIFKVNEANPSVYPERDGRFSLTVIPDEHGCLVFDAALTGESEHFVNVHKSGEDKRLFTLSLYSLSHDMKGRIPLRGDLHIHTCRSDGAEGPTTVCANYRAHGYDFFTISDHRRYYPSIEAMEFYKDMTDFTIVPGEEIHLPLNDVHYVNFGGTYSINALLSDSANDEKAGKELKYRSLDGVAPDPMEKEAFMEMIGEKAKELKI